MGFISTYLPLILFVAVASFLIYSADKDSYERQRAQVLDNVEVNELIQLYNESKVGDDAHFELIDVFIR